MKIMLYDDSFGHLDSGKLVAQDGQLAVLYIEEFGENGLVLIHKRKEIQHGNVPVLEMLSQMGEKKLEKATRLFLGKR